MDYDGLEIYYDPAVYAPSDDSRLSAGLVSEHLEALEAKIDVLDVGTGSGILGIVASISENAGRVTFLDINEKALALAKKNVEANRSKIKAMPRFVESDLLGEIPRGELFGLIIFNAPYLRNEKEGEEKEHNPWSGGEEGIELSVRFLEEAIPHLDKDGKIILNASSLGNLERLKRSIGAMGFSIVKEKKAHIFFEDIVALMLSRS